MLIKNRYRLKRNLSHTFAFCIDNSLQYIIHEVEENLLKKSYKESLKILENGEQDLDPVYFNCITNAKYDSFALPCCVNALKRISKKFKINTIGEMLNEMIYPSDNENILERTNIKNNFISETFFIFYKNIDDFMKYLDSQRKICIGYNKFVVESKVTTKMMTSRLLQTTPTTEIDLLKKHKMELENNKLDFNPFTLLKDSTTSIKVRSNCYKILHNIIYSRHRLFLIGIGESDTCSFCGETETKKHMLMECENARKLYKTLELVFSSWCDNKIKITYREILFGINVDRHKILINFILNHFKSNIISRTIKKVDENYIQNELNFL